VTYRFTVNGEQVALEVPGMRRLLDALREDLRLTGTKEGCGEGECGACSVLVDEAVVDACLVPVCQVEGPMSGRSRDWRTLRQAPWTRSSRSFLEAGGAQCGICTPGMLMAARAFLADGGAPTDASIREAIAGNLCRCTGYTKIIDAIATAAERGQASTA